MSILLSEPSIPGNERIDLIETAFGKQAERYLVNFIKLLCEKNLLREFGGCCDEYLPGVITRTTGSPRQPQQCRSPDRSTGRSTETKTGKTQRKENLPESENQPSLLGGVRVELEGKELDGTVKGRLDGLSRKLDSLTL